MADNTKPSPADVAAEIDHFRSEAIKQELQTGERGETTVDGAARHLPAGMQVGRPAFPMDDAEES